MQYYRLVTRLAQFPEVNVSVITKKANNYPDTIPRTNIIRIRSTLLPGISPLLFILGGFFQFARLYHQKKVDIVHVHLFGPTVILAWLIKVFFKVQFFIKTASDEFRLLAGNKIGLYLRFVKNFVLKCDRVQALNQNMLDYALKIGIPPQKVVFLPNGILLDQYSFLEKDESPLFTILFVGRLVRLKRIDTLLSALVLLKETGYSFRCNIIGDGDQYTHLFHLSRELQLGGQVEFLGFKQDVIPFYHQSSVLVLPSEIEGFSNVILESLSCGTPVIASNIPGNNEIIIDSVNGFLFPVGNSNILAEKLELLLNDSILLKKLSKNGRIQVEKRFSFEAFLNKIYMTYKSMI